jgi:glyoxylase I family protein
MIKLNRVHHIAIICSNYTRSKHFYTEVLGFKLEKEVYRTERQSYKGDLSLNGQYIIELFSFPSPPPRGSHPEASGLRHIAFEVDNLKETVDSLAQQNIACEAIRQDPYTHKHFTFFADPDGLPIELYER